MENTPNYNMNLPDYEDFADVEKLNENFEIIDAQMKSTEDALTTHLDKMASTSQAGHVQLSNATNSTNETLAATPRAVNSVLEFVKNSGIGSPNYSFGVNLNNVLTNGFYYTDGAVNYPSESDSSSGYLQVQAYLNTTYILQIFTAPAGTTWKRTRQNNIWSAWFKVADNRLQWIEATPQNGWQQPPEEYMRLRYTKDSLGFVHVEGHLFGGAISINTIITTLPINYRPITVLPINAVLADDGNTFSLQVSNDGSIFIGPLTHTGTIRINGSFYVGV